MKRWKALKLTTIEFKTASEPNSTTCLFSRANESSFDALQALRWFSTWTGPNSKADDWHMLWLNDDNYLEKQSRRPHLHSVKSPAPRPSCQRPCAFSHLGWVTLNTSHRSDENQINTNQHILVNNRLGPGSRGNITKRQEGQKGCNFSQTTPVFIFFTNCS